MRYFLLIFVLFCYSDVSFTKEKILSFHADIQIKENSQVRVVETIRVRAEGKKIKRGIFRDIPLIRKNKDNKVIRPFFELVSVSKNGSPEKYHTKIIESGDGLRIYIGNKSRYLMINQEYEYQIEYISSRQIFFHETVDELYWNITGDGWDFPIEESSAKIYFQNNDGPPFKLIGAYTGSFGSIKQDVETNINGVNTVSVKTLRTLNPGEGLTIKLQWAKGFITKPDLKALAKMYLKTSKNFESKIKLFWVIIAFYLFSWIFYGVDPKKGTIIPLFRPPGKISPAFSRMIISQKWDYVAFTSSIVNLATMGYLKIEEKSKTFNSQITLIRSKKAINNSEVSGEEKIILSELVNDNKVTLNSKNGKKISSTINKHKIYLGKKIANKYVKTNFLWRFLGFGLSLFVIYRTNLANSNTAPTMIAFMEYFIASTIFVNLFVSFFSNSLISSIKSGVLSFFVIGFLVFHGGLFALGAFGGDLLGIAFLIVVALTCAVFNYLIKAPTLAGRKMFDKIEGFKMYLSYAEEGLLNRLIPPEKTSELYQKYLPYALALDCEVNWATQFSNILGQKLRVAANQSRTSTHRSFHPSWYSGTRSFDSSSFCSNLGSSIASVISTSSASSSSSGGSSGGGGGGGGGGGW